MQKVTDMPAVELSIVIITKNQAWNVCRLIESALQESGAVASHEIVLVDSASTDDTVALACRYPIGVLRLEPDQHLCAAAGRYVGCMHASGRYVLFLDGDMELCRGWLDRALRLFHAHPDVAAVTGNVVDLPREATDHAHRCGEGNTAVAEEVRFGGGATMYRHAVLKEVGTFNPYIYSDEEPELCVRIRHAGYRVMKLQSPIAYHYTQPQNALSTVLARWRRNLYLGAGQSIRYHLGDGLLRTYLRERGYGLVPGLAVVVILITFAWSVWSGQRFGLWFLALIGVFTVVGNAMRKRSLHQTAVSLLQRLAILDGTIRGFLMKPRAPDEYPVRYNAVKEAPQVHSRHITESRLR